MESSFKCAYITPLLKKADLEPADVSLTPADLEPDTKVLYTKYMAAKSLIVYGTFRI